MQVLPEKTTLSLEQGFIVVRWSGIGLANGSLSQPVDWSRGVAETLFNLDGLVGVTIEIEFCVAPMLVEISELTLRDRNAELIAERSDVLTGRAAVFVHDKLAVLRSGTCLKLQVPETSSPAELLFLRAERVGFTTAPLLAAEIRQAFEERDRELDRFTHDIDAVIKDLSRRAHADYCDEQEILKRDEEIDRLRTTISSIYASRLWRSTRPLVKFIERIRRNPRLPRERQT
jgi:hypothetical protein